MTRRSAAAVICAILFLVGATGSPLPALAQAVDATLEDIVVTAQRREERLQDVPISVSAFSGDDLDKLNVTHVGDIVKYTPNLAAMSGPLGANSGFYFIRGVGQVDGNPANDPGVGTYLDGVYLGRITGASFDALDISRVEVLRGPQGTLFGRNTIGGAVNVVTADPTGEFGVKAKLIAGDRSRLDGQVVLDVPIAEGFAARISALARTQDGWGDRPVDGQEFGDDETVAGRIKLLWEPNEDFRAIFSADASDFDGTSLPTRLLNFDLAPSNGIPIFAPPPAPPGTLVTFVTPLGVPFLPQLPLETTNDELTTLISQDKTNQVEVWGTSLHFDWNLGPVTLTSITSYRELESLNSSDFDGGGFNFYDLQIRNDQDQLSQELHLSGLALNDRLNWLVGGMYYDEDINDYNNGICLGTNNGVPFFAPGFGATRYDGRCIRNNQGFTLEIESWAAFAHLVYQFTDRLSGTLGLRYTTDEKTQSYDFRVDNRDGVFSFFSLPGGPAPPTFLPGTITPTFSPANPFVGVPTTYNEDWNEFTPKIGLDFAWTDDVLLYGYYAAGFKSGGFNGRPTPNAMGQFGVVQPYDPETVDTFEVGLKSQWFDNRLRFNTAVFLSKYEDIQQLVVGPSGFFETLNAAEADIAGLEVELLTRPTDNWEFNLGIGYMDAEYDKLDPSSINAGITEDDPLPNTPELTFNVGGQYAFRIGDLGEFAFRADYSWQDDITFNAPNGEFERQDSYGLLNLRAGWTSNNDVLSVTVYGLNVADERYLTYAQDVSSQLGSAVGQVGEPDEWGVEFELRYR